MTPDLFCFVEDAPSREVAIRLIAHVNGRRSVPLALRDGFPKVMNGFGDIKAKLPALLEMTRRQVPCLVFTDLDRSTCPTAMLRDWLGCPVDATPSLPAAFLLRIVVREIEAWIMADREAFARFLEIAPANFVQTPEDLPDPRQVLLNTIRNKGKRPWHKHMLPTRPTARFGPSYNEKLCSFVRESWDPDRAAALAPSLARGIAALLRLP